MPDFVAKPNFFATNGKINAKLFGIFAKKPYLCSVNSIKQHIKVPRSTINTARMIMCLIATYSKNQKRNQIAKVRNLMEQPIKAEQDLKHFLYNLSFMNDMVVKGYGVEKYDEDYDIYELKDKALLKVATERPERCRISWSGTCVLYVYADSRQYSYHIRTSHSAFYKLSYARKNEWNGIKEGYALSDAEYKQRTANRHHNHRVIDWRKELGEGGVLAFAREMGSCISASDHVLSAKHIAMREKFQSFGLVFNIVEYYTILLALSKRETSREIMNSIKAYVVSWKCHEAYKKQETRRKKYEEKRQAHFIIELLKANKAAAKTKAFQNKDFSKLFSLYAEKFNLTEGARCWWDYVRIGFEKEIFYGTEREDTCMETFIADRYYNIMKKHVNVRNLTYKNTRFSVQHYGTLKVIE